jgi:copper(I)-binding protein
MRRNEGHAMKFFGVFACALAFASIADAAQVTLSSVWMRPAAQGAATARVYVDIRTDANIDLVGATTPVARKVEIVQVKTIGDPATEKVVKKFAVPGGTTTRLAYLGDHLRLVGVKRAVNNGDPVPIKLAFVDAQGKRFDVETDVMVRGLTFPGPK